MHRMTACADSLNELYNIPSLRCLVPGFKRRGRFLHESTIAPRTICSNETIGGLAVHNSHETFRLVHLTATRSRPACGTKPIILPFPRAHFWDTIGGGVPMAVQNTFNPFLPIVLNTRCYSCVYCFGAPSLAVDQTAIGSNRN